MFAFAIWHSKQLFAARREASGHIQSSLDTDLDYAYHLACYYRNQSSIHDPITDHDNNTITALKPFECLKDIKSLRKIVDAAAGSAVAAKNFVGATAIK